MADSDQTTSGSTRSSSSSTISAWTLIARAQGTGPQASRALGELLEQYRSFILWFMGVLRHPPDLSGDDLFQEYALTVVRQDVVQKLRRDGSLRGFLKTSIAYFIKNEWDKYHRRRRMVPTEFEHFASTTEADIDAAFLATLVNQAIELASQRSVNPKRFTEILRFLPGPQADCVKHAPYAAEIGLSEGNLNKVISEARASFDDCFDEIVRGTLDLSDIAHDPALVRRRVEQEKRVLSGALESPVPGVAFGARNEPN
jgi:DNA-directed RNA polymerase specialized sigma24 family protein